jgi:hypothetical protein
VLGLVLSVLQFVTIVCNCDVALAKFFFVGGVLYFYLYYISRLKYLFYGSIRKRNGDFCYGYSFGVG